MASGGRVIVKDRDRGYRKMMGRIRKLAGARAITVGIHGDEGGAGYEDGGDLTVGDVASIHEFGLNGVERSFIRAWADAEKSEHENVLRKLGESVVQGKNTVDEALEKAGVWLEADAQKFIQSDRVSPKTVKKDPEDNPTTLIATGQLVTSITHKVE